jgi:hypothetical protein
LKQAALDTELGSLPDIITSPIWRIKGAIPNFLLLYHCQYLHKLWHQDWTHIRTPRLRFYMSSCSDLSNTSGMTLCRISLVIMMRRRAFWPLDLHHLTFWGLGSHLWLAKPLYNIRGL